MGKLTHIDNQGKAIMVDVGDKTPQIRIAKAKGFIKLAVPTIELIQDNKMKVKETKQVQRNSNKNKSNEIQGTQNPNIATEIPRLSTHSEAQKPLCRVPYSKYIE